LDALGGISRLDYYFFVYTFTSSELVRKQASLVACCVVESSAVVDDLDANTLRVLISRAFKYGGVPRPILDTIYTQAITAVKAPTIGLSELTIKEKEDLEILYRPGFQAQANGGAITYAQNETAKDGASPNSGDVEFAQSGFKPVEVAA
jgi:hypothetical protein